MWVSVTVEVDEADPKQGLGLAAHIAERPIDLDRLLEQSQLLRILALRPTQSVEQKTYRDPSTSQPVPATPRRFPSGSVK